jgi:hypothetical protein
MNLIEQHVCSKLGDIKTCEDGLVVTEGYACVVDGATSVSGRRWTRDSVTGGQWAMKVLQKGVKQLRHDLSARQIIDDLTKCIHDAYRVEEVLEIMKKSPEERASASLILYSEHLQQIISVGDCQAAFLDKNGKIFRWIQSTKYNDDVMSQARCMYLETELARGVPLETLRESPDCGRNFIQPLLKGQRLFQNNPNAPDLYQYWVLDGFYVAEKGICVYDVPRRAKQVILASDGYPQILASLGESEIALQTLLKDDPLMMKQFKSTKGVALGSVSFDDRAYLRIEVQSLHSILQRMLSTLGFLKSIAFLVRRSWKV